MARIDGIYAYFLTTYGENLGSRYESHKKSELRDTYNRIIKTNKESPLYRINESENVGKLAIDIKERSNAVYNAISNLTNGGDDITAVLNKRIAVTSDEESVSAVYIGDESSSAESFDLEVESLATPQINQGNFLDPTKRSFEEGQYSFDLTTKSGTYEFQYNVNVRDTNLDVQQKIVRLVNSSNVGLEADLTMNKKGENALVIASKSTGTTEDGSNHFSIDSTLNWRELNTLGISNVTEEAKNSVFTLNGSSHSSMNNTFTVNKSFEVTLRYPSNSTVHVGLIADTEALSMGVSQLLDSFNGLHDLNNATLKRETSRVYSSMATELNEIGISSDENGSLLLDNEIMAEKINSGNRESVFSTLNRFKDALFNQASKASINPINYVDKLIVEYKNPNHNLAHPYASSQYSGMLVDYGL